MCTDKHAPPSRKREGRTQVHFIYSSSLSRVPLSSPAALALSCPPAKEVIEASNWNPEGEGVLEEKIT